MRSVAAYVGSAKCAACHANETEAWRGSHHALAMQPPSAATVLGNFEHATFTNGGVTSTFLNRHGEFFVRTDGADGKLAEFRVAYTFGIDPLQQYLLEYPGGRLQALSVAWDARAKNEGGQRWFHLYPNEKIDYRDVLHWTGPAQNWNHMCAECHSTNLQKNYREAEDRFETTWTDVNVACEACHGAGSRHVAWAERGARSDEALHDPGFGLEDFSGGAWTFGADGTIARRSPPLDGHAEVEMCGRCHSRRARIWPEYRHGELLAQTHRVALLEEGLYHADGQILDEVYEYGSFLQSRMYAAGVTCSNCHDPHSARLRAEGNGVCAQCHQASHYDTLDHHYHLQGSSGSECVSCHMAERTFMVIDGRRDHSFRVPRPDLSERLGTPNACTDCHRDRSAHWAAQAVVRRYGPERRHGAQYGVAIHAGRNSRLDSEQSLTAIAGDESLPAIVRATALSLLPEYLSANSLPTLVESLKDSDALVRRSAVEAFAALDPQSRAPSVAPLLADPVRTVRLEALGAVLDAPRSVLSGLQPQAFDAAVVEYRRVQSLNADRADAQVNLGMLEVRLGNAAAARTAYERAIRVQPSFVPAYVNLADLYRAQGLEDRAEQTLRTALTIDAHSAEAREALGFSLVRQKRLSEAVDELARAAQLRPEVPRYAYVHAVALKELGSVRAAIDVLTKAHERHPAERGILTALVEYTAEAGDREAANRWARKLAGLSPDDS